jgi:hypothetical protein
MTGSAMTPFDPAKLDRVRSMPPRYRAVTKEKKA